MFHRSYPRDVTFAGVGGSYPSDIWGILNRIPVIIHPTATIVKGVYRGAIYTSHFKDKNIDLKFSKNGWVEGFIDGKIPFYGNTYGTNNIHLQELSVDKDIVAHLYGNISTTSFTFPGGGTIPLYGSIGITGRLDIPAGTDYFSAWLIKYGE